MFRGMMVKSPIGDCFIDQNESVSKSCVFVLNTAHPRHKSKSLKLLLLSQMPVCHVLSCAHSTVSTVAV